LADADLELSAIATGQSTTRAEVWAGLRTRAARSLALPLALYALGAILLTFEIGEHPSFLYAWEPYTAWQGFAFWDEPSWEIFRLTDGLMTDSGRTPLVVFPLWLGFKVGGVGLESMRLPVALIAAASVPLLWLVGRRLASERIALLAAILLALSPAFLLFGRSATDVGISLTPALLTIYILIRVLQEPQRWPWLVALQALLVLNSYGYAPIRFLWLLALALLGLQMLMSRGSARRWLGLGVVVTALVLPLTVVMLDRDPRRDVRHAVVGYYHGRGEQILDFNKQPGAYTNYLQLTEAEQTAGRASGDKQELALRLFKENAGDLAKTFLDFKRRQTLTDFSKAEGRLYPVFLVPFFLLGMGLTVRGAPRRLEDRVLLMLFWGFSLPILLTSRVDIGRLIFALPLLFLFVAIGFVWTATKAAQGAERLGRNLGKGPSAVARPVALTALLSGALMAIVAWSTLREYSADLMPPAEQRLIPAFEEGSAEAARRGGSVLVTGEASLEIEALGAAVLRLSLEDRYQFVSLATPARFESSSQERRPALYYGGVLDRLKDPTQIPGFCNNVYYVVPRIEERFAEEIAKQSNGCVAPLFIQPLPK
jgi:4-amino-4-deoxy-L-arabinose transferase-like glycosyltransferase